MRLSIVATLYYSAPCVREFYARARAAAEQLVGSDWEIVFVNDGSPDDALDLAVALHLEDPRVTVVDLSRNFGHAKAMMTGLMHARGELVYLLDVDLEEEPEWLARFHEALEATGADVVYGVQTTRKGRTFERVTGWFFYTIFNWLSTHPLPRNVVTARLMRRRYVEALVQHQEREAVMGGLWVITGFAQSPMPIVKGSHSPSTYTFTRKLTLLIDSITSFSSRPLVLIFYLGSLITLGATGAAGWMVIRALFFEALLEGWLSLIVSIWLLGGITIFCLGLLGMYLSKIHHEVKHRPYTIVRQLYRK